MKCRASQSWRWPFAGPKKTSITVYTLIRVNKLATLVDRIAFGSFVKQVKNRRYQALQEPFDTLVASVLERLTSQPVRDSDQATPLTSTPRPSRTLNEEVQFDRARVTSLDWSLYPILRFPEIPEVVVELIDRPDNRPWARAKRRPARYPPPSPMRFSMPPTKGCARSRSCRSA